MESQYKTLDKTGSFQLSICELRNPQFPVDLVTFTAEILNGKLHFFCSETTSNKFILKVTLLPKVTPRKLTQSIL